MEILYVNFITAIVIFTITFFFSGGTIPNVKKENIVFAAKVAGGVFILLPFYDLINEAFNY